jgi:DNA repair exonuclease SbcCD ATPase subunit
MPSYRSLQAISLYSDKKQQLMQDIGAAKVVTETNTRLKTEIEELTRISESMEKAAGILSQLGEDRQREAQEQIELLVSQGLQKIFGSNLNFKVQQSVKGKTPVVEFLIQTTLPDGRVREADILSAMGGGIAAVAGFLLRLVVLLLDKSRKSAIIVLDETFAHVSDSYLPVLAEFLREVVDKAKVQIIMVTHQKDFAEVADKAYRYSLDSNGYTVAQEF